MENTSLEVFEKPTQPTIAYYRVSTKKQGLGLDAQKSIVFNFLHKKPDYEFLEKETGTSTDNRVQLKAALDMCKKTNGKLIIANLSRLSRNVHFVSGLLESRVDFVCCDNPMATPLLIHILSAVAQEEAKNISKNTKASLEAKRMREIEKGNVNFRFGPKVSCWSKDYIPNGDDKLSREELISNRRRKEFLPWISIKENKKDFDVVAELYSEGFSIGEIVKILNDERVVNRYGRDFWCSTDVSRLLKKVKENPDYVKQKEYA